MIFISVIFFFQAEDGIRVRDVTGVQTCALPISASAACWALRILVAASKMRKAQQAALAGRPYATLMNSVRSEERRVGKEGSFGEQRVFCKTTMEETAACSALDLTQQYYLCG